MVLKNNKPTVFDLMKKPALWANAYSLKISYPDGRVEFNGEWQNSDWEPSHYTFKQLINECEFVGYIE